MANVYIEARPKGRPEGDPIESYVVEDKDGRQLAIFQTQELARGHKHHPLIAPGAPPQ